MHLSFELGRFLCKNKIKREKQVKKMMEDDGLLIIDSKRRC